MENKGLIKNKVDRYIRHIQALETSYQKMIDILKKDMDKKTNEESGEESITLKDFQIKAFSEGILRSSETANALLIQISEKENELEEMRKEIKEGDNKITKEEAKSIKKKHSSRSAMNTHLE